ncbi:MAG: FixH family protein [Betaproteobacteria bacterium]|nr:FixH family protein [Betaproteobacteria bacterium]
MMRNVPATPWYREPWPWLLMAGPFLVVIAGLITLWIAVASDDGLVADDYYKRGLAINQVLARDAVASARHYRARVMFSPALDRVRVTLAGDDLPAAVVLRLSHPTRAGLDRILRLAASGPGVYESALSPPDRGSWRVTLEDPDRTWRLTGAWRLPGEPVIKLGM